MKQFKNIDDFITYVKSEQITESPDEMYLSNHKIASYSLVEHDHADRVTLCIETENRPVIGNEITLSFPELNCEGLVAKIDTGAEMSCLHAENIKYTDQSGSVIFEFNEKRITMNCSGTIEIRTADHGVDKRPLVVLDVECEYGVVKGVEFNLNDRSEMPHQILLGKSFLQAGEFLIDPSVEPNDEEHV